MLRVDLRRLILSLCLLSLVVGLGASLYASHLVQRDLLLTNALEANRNYAQKVASLTNTLLSDIADEMAYSARQLAVMDRSPERVIGEISRLYSNSKHFNSLIVVRADGTPIGEAPSDLGIVGKRVDTERSRFALSLRKPYLSEPFKAVTGRWVVSHVEPIFAGDGRYLGYMIGSIYLHSPNALQALLGTHFYRDGSSLFVVDQAGQLIYHPQSERIGQSIADNPSVKAVLKGTTGQMRIEDDERIDMLTGYAPVPFSGWGIVSQRPAVLALQRLNDLAALTVRNALPLLLVSLLLIWGLSKLIARPLWDLASLAKQMDDTDASDQIRGVRAWYFEAAQLKRAMLAGLWSMNHKIHNLRQESTTDPLSGLLNRRGMEHAVEEIRAGNLPTAVVAIDIDRFKVINDTLGHDAGDAVIRLLAAMMRQESRGGDQLVRAGGEEFMMLLPNTGLLDAARVAERLRMAIEGAPAVDGMRVTVSCGVSHFPTTHDDIDVTIKRADTALYFAKNNGRNVTAISDPATPRGYRLFSGLAYPAAAL